MLVGKAFNGVVIDGLPADSVAAVSVKLDRVAACFSSRLAWFPAVRRVEILQRLAQLLVRDFEIPQCGFAGKVPSRWLRPALKWRRRSTASEAPSVRLKTKLGCAGKS
jgi:hypothetical protein